MKSKRGVSIMISYVLLIVFAMIMGTIVYNVLKTYVPKDVPECPESVSIFIKEINYTENSLDITLLNNGLFDISGYFIRATNSSNETIATMDLSEFLKAGYAKNVSNVVMFPVDNPMKPNDKQTQIFGLPEKIYSIEIIPVRFQEEDGKSRFVSCGGSRVSEVVKISVAEEACIPESTATTCGAWVCGTKTNNCDEEISCGECTGTDVCTGIGQCVPPAECTDTCESLGYGCEYHTICGVSENCGDCLSNEICNATWQCEISCGDGVIDLVLGETCDDGGIIDGDGCNSTCQIETGWNCDGEPSLCSYCNNNYICDVSENCLCGDCFNKRNGCDLGFTCQGGTCFPAIAIGSCKSYCFDLNIGYDPVTSGCVNNCGGSCAAGTCEPGGDEHCDSPTTECCCVPYQG